ncbi:hypothetical protein ZHAS_00003629 [Anopheles sinensis]|uniref:DUF3421 domain-containing protein n=1 Tax=Anopheles sinensis TaxID=74873 RepID=A0A084VET4_ANOSI|nr:hypothetical protein ZHAS_00003629 [Anopheles sinensis]
MILSLHAQEVTEPNLEVQKQHDGELHVYFIPSESNSTAPPDSVTVSDEVTFWGYTWIGSGNGHVPHGAIVGGRTSNGENLYIGRAYHGDDLLPGKIHPSLKRLYVSAGGREYYYNNYEALVEVRRGFRVVAEIAGTE